MKKGFLDITTARTAIRDLVSNIEGIEYDTTYIPVTLKVAGGFQNYNVLVLYKKGNYEEMLEEINNKFKNENVDALLKPSENYIQLAFFEQDDNIPNYKRVMCFKQNNDRFEKNEMLSFIVDPKYAYIDDVMNKWFEFEEELDIKKSDDIYQFIDVISKKKMKKDKFVKKLFRSSSY